MRKEKVKKSLGKRIWGVVRTILIVIVVFAVVVVGGLSVTEYRPDDTEELEIKGEAAETVSVGDTLDVMTWNVGYGSLGDYADFFMDGGSGVNTSTKDQTNENLAAISDEISSVDPDILMLQEVDTNSKRSSHINEEDVLLSGLDGYAESFAYNYKVVYIPYPWPNMGQVNAGIMTATKYDMESATRVSLPCPFNWPYRLCNLKRCLDVSRIAIEGSDAELVVVNLHLEAYDSGEGKAAQTAQLRELLEEETAKGNYVIAGGDFNQCFSNADTSKLENGAESVWTPGMIDVSEFENLTFVTGDTASCRSLNMPLAGNDPDDIQYYIIDGFIVSNNITVNNVETQDLGFVNSDHNPVVMNITLN